MLHVWWASGEQLAALPGEEVREVRCLKRKLQKLCGASRFRQRLLHDGLQLEDGIVLQSPMDIQLVVLPFAETSYLQAYRLLEECASGDTLALEAILQRPQDPNFALGTGSLSAPAENGHVEVVRSLLEAGADKDAPNEGGESPLWTASSQGHVEIVRLLLEAGASKDAPGLEGRTSLFTAASQGHVEVARLLCAAGADTNAPAKCGQTPLLAACWKGHVQLVSLLRCSGADCNAPDRSGRSPLWVACLMGHVEIAGLLIEAGADQDLPGTDGQSPLLVSSVQGHLGDSRK